MKSRPKNMATDAQIRASKPAMEFLCRLQYRQLQKAQRLAASKPVNRAEYNAVLPDPF